MICEIINISNKDIYIPRHQCNSQPSGQVNLHVLLVREQILRNEMYGLLQDADCMIVS